MAWSRTVVVVMWAVVVMDASASDVCAPNCAGGSSGRSLMGELMGNLTGSLTVDPANCTQYYSCEDAGGAVTAVGPYPCPFFEYFDDALGDCRPIAEAPLGYCTSPCDPCALVCDTPGALLPDPLNCTKFYVCLNTGDLASFDCDPGLTFDYALLECREAVEDNLGCFIFCEECEAYCAGVGLVERDPLDCSAYYACEPPYKVHKVCPEGLLFDPDIGECSASAECDDSCFVH